MTRRQIALFIAVTAAIGCDLDEAQIGDACVRTTECRLGLVCIEGECTRDLSPVADQSSVPELMRDAGAMGGPGPATRDASMPDAGAADPEQDAGS